MKKTTNYKTRGFPAVFYVRAGFRLFVLLLLASLAATLTGCDGGIFGTGDGGKDAMLTDGDNATLENNLNGDVASTEFSNDQAVTGRNDALVRIVNAASDSSLPLVFVNNNIVETPLLPLPGLSQQQGYSDYLILDNSANALRAHRAADIESGIYTSPLAVLDPLILAAGSSTTVIARGRADTTISSFELVAIANQISSATGNAMIRALHASVAIGTETLLDVTLTASGVTGGGATEAAANLGYFTGVSQYHEAPAGTYKVTVTERFNASNVLATANPVVIESGEVLTLIIRDSTADTPTAIGEILVIRDSELEIR